ncbi:MAG: aconitate hydratase, partial [Elusimicrobiota bacterium]|nr:aconitate hydratase [Elusimicrobiota bacterium]
AGVHNVIVAGESYGQGSSREHAAMCPMYLGVKAVVAKSFERIHAANLLNFGIAPLTFKNPADYAAIQAGDKLTCEDWRAAVQPYKESSAAAAEGKPVILRNARTGVSIECVCDLSARQRAILTAGGLLNHTTGK